MISKKVSKIDYGRIIQPHGFRTVQGISHRVSAGVLGPGGGYEKGCRYADGAPQGAPDPGQPPIISPAADVILPGFGWL